MRDPVGRLLRLEEPGGLGHACRPAEHLRDRVPGAARKRPASNDSADGLLFFLRLQQRLDPPQLRGQGAGPHRLALELCLALGRDGGPGTGGRLGRLRRGGAGASSARRRQIASASTANPRSLASQRPNYAELAQDPGRLGGQRGLGDERVTAGQLGWRPGHEVVQAGEAVGVVDGLDDEADAADAADADGRP